MIVEARWVFGHCDDSVGAAESRPPLCILLRMHLRKLAIHSYRRPSTSAPASFAAGGDADEIDIPTS
jgi:hypothetical protein